MSAFRHNYLSNFVFHYMVFRKINKEEKIIKNKTRLILIITYCFTGAHTVKWHQNKSVDEFLTFLLLFTIKKYIIDSDNNYSWGKKVINFKMSSCLNFSNLENTLFVRHCQECLTNKSVLLECTGVG